MKTSSKRQKTDGIKLTEKQDQRKPQPKIPSVPAFGREVVLEQLLVQSQWTQKKGWYPGATTGIFNLEQQAM